MLYENEKDRSREMVVGEIVRKKMGFHAFHRSKHLEKYDLYFVDENNKLKGIVEIKCRSTRTFNSLNYSYLDWSKWKCLMTYEMFMSAPCWFVPVYKDGVYATRIGHLTLHDTPVVHTGRTDRGTNDVELAIQIENKHFTRMGDADKVFNI